MEVHMIPAVPELTNFVFFQIPGSGGSILGFGQGKLHHVAPMKMVVFVIYFKGTWEDYKDQGIGLRENWISAAANKQLAAKVEQRRQRLIKSSDGMGSM